MAPDARVRHLEELAGGARPIDQSLAGGDDAAVEVPPVTLQELQRRHELLAVFKCYGPFHLIRVVPQILVLAVGEVIVAELAGNRARARAVVRAWRWNLGRMADHPPSAQAAEGPSPARATRRSACSRSAGSARLSAYGRRVFQHGFHGAHADELAAAEEADELDAGGRTGRRWHGRTRLVAAAPAVAASAERPADHVRARPGRRSGPGSPSGWSPPLVVVIGTPGGPRRAAARGRPVRALSRAGPRRSPSSSPAGTRRGWGRRRRPSPALALAGVVGTVLLGAMGLTQKVLIFACIPIGVWGVVRLLRPFGSQRASLVAGLSYLAMALPYNALALGRWGALVVYAGAPWVLARLFRATGSAPYGADGRPAGTAAAHGTAP